MSNSWRSGEKKGKRKRARLAREREASKRRARSDGELRSQAKKVVEASASLPTPPPIHLPLMDFGPAATGKTNEDK